MQRLADISAFEHLQQQAHHSMGIVCSMAVFNDVHPRLQQASERVLHEYVNSIIERAERGHRPFDWQYLADDFAWVLLHDPEVRNGVAISLSYEDDRPIAVWHNFDDMRDWAGKLGTMLGVELSKNPNTESVGRELRTFGSSVRPRILGELRKEVQHRMSTGGWKKPNRDVRRAWGVQQRKRDRKRGQNVVE